MDHILDAIGDLIPFLIFVVVGLLGLIKKRLEQKFSAPPKRMAKTKRSASTFSQPEKKESKGKSPPLSEATYQQVRRRAQETFTIEPLKSNRYKDRSNEIITVKVKKENIVQGIIWSEILGKPRAFNPPHGRKK
ncbi:hypothetical protein LCY76_14305 [Fictibacillus sp. KIGAM418]|uniref:Uncharacterized protein n=1 Tax=Fictibacillus marinisediminis TaxID=2878389 RepID=A0A9X2BFY5_9BACL|nr:hypothetical protein [Fictibacillus marinisediminis]MCK6257757.1 hypothetical protein [Fictibacillus marinisediminis]